jgi:hypothetical protein
MENKILSEQFFLFHRTKKGKVDVEELVPLAKKLHQVIFGIQNYQIGAENVSLISRKFRKVFFGCLFWFSLGRKFPNQSQCGGFKKFLKTPTFAPRYQMLMVSLKSHCWREESVCIMQMHVPSNLNSK